MKALFLRFLSAPLLIALAFAALPGTALAGDASIGEAIAGPCVACHGVGGAEPISNYPVLAGQHEKYLLYTLLAYKSGERANAVMAGQVANMTRRDFQNLAAYFASQPSPLR